MARWTSSKKLRSGLLALLRTEQLVGRLLSDVIHCFHASNEIRRSHLSVSSQNFRAPHVSSRIPLNLTLHGRYNINQPACLEEPVPKMGRRWRKVKAQLSVVRLALCASFSSMLKSKSNLGPFLGGSEVPVNDPRIGFGLVSF